MVDVRYAACDGIHIAYRAEGAGPAILIVSNWLTDVEATPQVAFYGRLIDHASLYSTVLWFDQPGSGHSDPLPTVPSLETYADWIGAVLDDAGVETATLVAWDIGTAPALLFAAAHPERTAGLIACGGSARWLEDDDYFGLPLDQADAFIDGIVAMWGKPAYARFLAPSMADDEAACEEVARWLRHALSPGAAHQVFGMALRIDVRAALPLVQCPTLVMVERSARSAAPLPQAEYLATHIRHGRLSVYDSADHLPYTAEHAAWYDDAIEEFVTGKRPARDVDERVLATILFTDVVGSTATAATVGDRAWRRTLDAVEADASAAVARHRGRLVKTTGDGLLATFDGPARAARCALSLRDNARRHGLEIRAGVHTGEVEIRGDDIGGIAVHIASRVMSTADGGEVMASATVRDLTVGAGLRFDARGEHDLRGIPGRWSLFSLSE